MSSVNVPFRNTFDKGMGEGRGVRDGVLSVGIKVIGRGLDERALQLSNEDSSKQASHSRLVSFARMDATQMRLALLLHILDFVELHTNS